jgi:MFS family permease
MKDQSFEPEESIHISKKNSIAPNNVTTATILKTEPDLTTKKNTTIDDSSHPENENDYKYSWCCIRPVCCKRCESWKFIFVIICLCCFIQNLVTSGIGSVVVSTMEKEFYITSTQSGIFLGIYDFAAFLSSPIIGFFGDLKNSNKMRIISVSLLLVTLGSYSIGATVFAKKPDVTIYSGDAKLDYSSCRSNLSETECSLTVGSPENTITQNILILLCISNMIIGFGSVSLYSIGIAYIEEIVDPKKASLCQAIFYGVGKISMHIL